MPPRRRTTTTRRAPAPAKPLPPGRSPDFNATTTITSMANEHLQCRDFGHSWRPYTAEWNSALRLYQVQLRCQRCRTVRERHIGQAGQLLSNRYDYADGYVVKGMGRLDGRERDLLRLESVRRVLPDDAARDDE